jgi:hypothetical protein
MENSISLASLDEQLHLRLMAKTTVIGKNNLR